MGKAGAGMVVNAAGDSVARGNVPGEEVARGGGAGGTTWEEEEEEEAARRCCFFCCQISGCVGNEEDGEREATATERDEWSCALVDRGEERLSGVLPLLPLRARVWLFFFFHFRCARSSPVSSSWEGEREPSRTETCSSCTGTY